MRNNVVAMVQPDGFSCIDASHFRPVVFDMAAALQDAEVATAKQRQRCAIIETAAATRFATRADLERSVFEAERVADKIREDLLQAREILRMCTKEHLNAVSAHRQSQMLASEIECQRHAASTSLERLLKEQVDAEEGNENALRLIPDLSRDALVEQQTKQRHQRTAQVMRAGSTLYNLQEQLHAIDSMALDNFLARATQSLHMAQRSVEERQLLLRSAQKTHRLAVERRQLLVDALDAEIRGVDKCLAEAKCNFNALERHRLELGGWAVQAQSSPAARRWWYP